MKYNNKTVDIIKFLQVWRSIFDMKMKTDDWHYTYLNKDMDEGRLLENLKEDPRETISDLFEYGRIPEDADIYEV